MYVILSVQGFYLYASGIRETESVSMGQSGVMTACSST